LYRQRLFKAIRVKSSASLSAFLDEKKAAEAALVQTLSCALKLTAEHPPYDGSDSRGGPA
jgi:hypothetical protein